MKHASNRSGIVVVIAACAVLGTTLAGCGYSARDENARLRDMVIEAKPGNGSSIATSVWSGDDFAGGQIGPSRLADATAQTSDQVTVDR